MRLKSLADLLRQFGRPGRGAGEGRGSEEVRRPRGSTVGLVSVQVGSEGFCGV